MYCPLNAISGTVQVVIVLPTDSPEKSTAKNVTDSQYSGQLPPIAPIVLHQPLEAILSSTRVQIIAGRQAEDPNDIQTSMNSLDALILKLSNLETSKLGISPGFDTVESKAAWRTLDIFPEYQTLDSVNSIKGVIPMPCPKVALEYFLRIKDAWRERLEWAASDSEVCSCIGLWQHRPATNILQSLSNQIIEQLMVREASACLRNQPKLVPIWSECYIPEKCPSPDEMSALYLHSSVRLLATREDYTYFYVECAMKARHTIDICVCYLFYTDPVARYIILDLLPFVAARGVKVRILFESMTLESQNLQGVFEVVESQRGDSARESFPYNLPQGSPPFHQAQKKFRCASEFVREVLGVASSNLSIDCRFWFARDKRCNYRIKNHTKCHIFDGKMNGRVIAGGSNVVPRPGSLDTDFIVEGGSAGMYQLHFENMWEAMNPCCGGIDMTAEEEKRECDEMLLVDNDPFTENTNKCGGSSSKILFLPSFPSSSGEDVILRCVLGGIKRAKESILMCMGHCNIPWAVTEALKEATERGVKVSVLTNSLYSCDLRCGQRDLFKSLEQMLVLAPKVELFVTAVKEGRKEGPPFLHSKYVVVDSEWVAVGSWNLWTRSAFYEMEAEILVSSTSFAADLRKKFEREKNEFTVPVKTAKECEHFLPKGCAICAQFGSFFET